MKTREITKYAEKHNYNLSFTGHYIPVIIMNLTYQNRQAGLQLHRLMQSTVKRYVDKHKENMQ